MFTMKLFVFFTFVLTYLLSSTVTAAENCSWEPQFVSNNTNYAVFEIENKNVLWSTTIPKSAVVDDFYKEINSFTNTNQTIIRQNQLKIFLKHFNINDPGIQMMQLILAGQLGKTVKTRCLELLLLDLHLSRVGKNYYTEYGAYIFTKKENIRIIYKSSDDASVPESLQQKLDVKAAHDAGYELYAHLHLHPFNMHNPSGDIGGAAWPSGAGESYGDMGVYTSAYENYNLKQAWVTNGFDTLILNPTEFYQLKNLKKTK